MPSTFSADIARFIEKSGLSADLVLRKIALDAFQGLLLRSPVDTGRFRASWRIGINKVDSSVAGAGEQGAAEPQGALAEAKFGDTIHISNNLPYAKPLENGHSRQAPNGVLGPTFQDLEDKVAAAVRSAKS